MLKVPSPSLAKNFVSLSSKPQMVTDVTSKLDEKVKGTFFENWLRFWKNVFIDYREVVTDVRKNIKQKPTKAFFIFSGFSFLSYCATHNPNEISFRNKCLESANNLLLVHTDSQNTEAIKHLRFLESCYNKQLLRRLNLGIASVMWIDNYSEECDTYETNCSYLQLGYSGIASRIVDFGFLNNWWVVSRRMLDYDINF